MGVIVLYGSKGARRVPIADRLVVGRDPESDVVLDDPMVAPRHVEIRRAGERFELHDLGSRHGTYVNEHKVRTALLANGDEILVGVHRIRFEERERAAGSTEAAEGSAAALPARPTRFRRASEIADEAELRADYEKLRAAFAIAAVAGGAREVRPLIERILGAALEVAGAERAAAVVVDPQSGVPFLRLTLNAADPGDDEVALSTQLVAEMLRRREGVIVTGAVVADRPSESMAAQRIRTAMCAPLLHRDEVLGLIYVDSRLTGRRFDDKDLELLEAFANQAADALKAALSVEDVERARAEERARLEGILRHFPDGVLLLDGERRVRFANGAARRILGDVGLDPDAALPPALGDLRLDAIVDGRVHRVELGERPRRILELAGTRSAELGGGLVLAVRDVTAERTREEQVERHERLAVLGRLAAGVAHDFNNLLTVILTYSEAVARDPASAHAPAYARRIRDCGESAARLSRQLLVFAAPGSTGVETVDAGALVEEMGRLWSRLLADRLRVVIRRPARPALIRIDRSQLEQVVLNLIINARDATPHGGTLTLAVQEVSEQPGGEALPARTCVEITAEDDGVGMAPEIAERAFEPFFTTKGEDGTGLGLATVHAVVQRAGGTIAVSSRAGHGSCFRILLPAGAAPPRAPADVARPSLRRATILVVEDHAAVREATARTLRDAGHMVFAAADAAEALARAETLGQGLELVVVDLVLPAITGEDLVTELRRRRPGLRVLYVSGFLGASVNERLAREGAEVLAKPFGGEALLERVTACLAKVAT
jgi:signal transduction histidine kinase/CheY-like chemotaxis protein